MPTFKTAAFTEREAWPNTRNASRSYRDVQAPVRYMRIEYTLVGTEANADIIKLEMPRIEGFLIPEVSRVSNTNAGDADLDMKIQRIGPTGAAVDLTTAASLDNNSVAFGRPTAGTPELQPTDTIQVVLSNVEAVVAGGVLLFELFVGSPEGI
jgi:hypothetical protein